MVHSPGGIASMYGDPPSRSRRAPRRLSPSRCAPQHPPIEARRADRHQRQCVPRETWTRALTEDGHHATDEPSRVLTSDPVVSWTSFRSVSHVPKCVAHRAADQGMPRRLPREELFRLSLDRCLPWDDGQRARPGVRRSHRGPIPPALPRTAVAHGRPPAPLATLSQRPYGEGRTARST